MRAVNRGLFTGGSAVSLAGGGAVLNEDGDHAPTACAFLSAVMDLGGWLPERLRGCRPAGAGASDRRRFTK